LLKINQAQLTARHPDALLTNPYESSADMPILLMDCLLNDFTERNLNGFFHLDVDAVGPLLSLLFDIELFVVFSNGDEAGSVQTVSLSSPAKNSGSRGFSGSFGSRCTFTFDVIVLHSDGCSPIRCVN
jgi:hypothetical protein